MPTKPSASAQVRELLGRIGAPPQTPAPSGGETKPADRETGGPFREPDAAAAEALASAKAAMRRAMGLPPLPVPTVGNPAPRTLVGLVAEALAPERNRSASGASAPVWRSDVARRVREQRAGGRCECRGACGMAHGLTTGAGARCAVKEGDWIAGPGDYPTEPRRAVLVAVTLDRSRSARDPDNMEVRCPECADGIARRALASTPAKAGKRGASGAARGETETGMEFD